MSERVHDEPERREFGKCVCMGKVGGPADVSCTGKMFGQMCDGWEPESGPSR